MVRDGLHTDYHCHLLPGIDDGPATVGESVEMAAALKNAGYDTVCCTPHLVRGSYEADNATVRRLAADLQRELSRRGIGMRLLPGREYYLDEFLLGYLQDPLPLGDSRLLLIEIPPHVPPAFVRETCYRIACSRYTPVIAHPERCPLLMRGKRKEERGGLLGAIFGTGKRQGKEEGEDQSLVDYLVEIGCRFQGNLGSFAGVYGERVRQSALAFRERGLYAYFGTDLHSVGGLQALSMPLVEESVGG